MLSNLKKAGRGLLYIVTGLAVLFFAGLFIVIGIGENAIQGSSNKVAITLEKQGYDKVEVKMAECNNCDAVLCGEKAMVWNVSARDKQGRRVSGWYCDKSGYAGSSPDTFTLAP